MLPGQPIFCGFYTDTLHIVSKEYRGHRITDYEEKQAHLFVRIAQLHFFLDKIQKNRPEAVYPRQACLQREII